MGKQQNSHALRNSLSVTELSRQPFPGSEKIHIPGSRPDLQVALREIHLTPTRLASGGEEINPPLRVYDTSGPYTDPAVQIDVRKGLPALRQYWIAERGDSEALPAFSSAYARLREMNLTPEPLRFDLKRKPRRALPGKNVSQLWYARRGIITPEMEYVAIRENLALRRAQLDRKSDV